MKPQFYVPTVISGGRSPLLNDLAAYWKLEDNWIDSVGGLTLSPQASPVFAAGIVGQAADFESGSSQWAEISDQAAVSVGDIDFTIAVWVKPESLPSQPAIVTKEDNVKEYRVDLDGSNRPRFILFDSGNGVIAQAIATTFGSLSAGSEYLIIAEHDVTNNKARIGVNGGTMDEVATSGAPHDGSAKFRFGARGAPGSEVNFLDGLVDEVGLWKRLLASDEKTELYNSGSGITYPF